MATKTTTPNASNNIEKVITWIEKLGVILENKGLKGILVTLIIAFIAIIVGYYAFNPETMVIKVQKIIQEQSIKEFDKRMKADPEIRSSLIELRNNIDAERTFLFETHNGGENLTGLKFLYVDMTFDEPIKGLERKGKEFLNLRTSNYPIMSYIYDNDFIVLDVEELDEIDPEIYYRVKKGGVKKIAMLVTYGNKKPSGCIGAAFYHDSIPDRAILKSQFKIHALTISDLLNAEDE